jgi:hypothetical protein
MRWSAATVILTGALIVASPEANAVARKERATPKFKPNSIVINYVEPKSPELQPVYKLVREHHTLEKIRDLLRPLRLPHQLLLQTRDCDGIPNAWSNEESVTVCFELVDEIWKKAPEKTTPAGIAPIDALIGPVVDVFLHEIGHAVFQALKIPLFGREEDAADQFSTYIMLRFDKEESRRLVLGSAYQYRGDLLSPTVTLRQQQFADEHGTPAQRFFNLLCTAYGADPKLFGDVVEKGFLPSERAEGCKREYRQVSFAFDTLIGPYVDRRLARKFQKSWLAPITTTPKR